MLLMVITGGEELFYVQKSWLKHAIVFFDNALHSYKKH